MRYTRLLLPALAVGVISPVALADFVPTGDPVSGGSWGQGFVYDGSLAGDIDLLAVKIVSGGPFKSPTFRYFDAADWGIFSESPAIGGIGYAGAGTLTNPVDSLSFHLWFAPDDPEPVDFIISAWHPLERFPFEQVRVSWDGLDWSFDSAHWDITREVVMVPVPGAALLGVVGVSVLACVRRRID